MKTRQARQAIARGPDRQKLRALYKRVDTHLRELIRRGEGHPADWTDPYLDPARIEEAVPKAAGRDRNARLFLRKAVMAHAAHKHPLPENLLAYVSMALRAGDPADAFGMARHRGRDAHIEHMKKRGAAYIVAFLALGPADGPKALGEAAGMLGYSGPTRARTLTNFCGADLAELRHRHEGSPHREWFLTLGAWRACRLYLRLHS